MIGCFFNVRIHYVKIHNYFDKSLHEIFHNAVLIDNFTDV